ncbi:ATP-binding protein [Paenibacillus sp. GSMTC-2017]|uniref:sensor histidine kinase n=1 Tax=Paenibacillus sp. GSMTC-2017 TaxID=2794350 RepID=UPI0018D7DCB0|nr:ATP-binding protein [Paenibacillus sp. GSMTC-2017]MBH5316310.1 ATP-binding protein [Paenibacillus sp. GSMTC-2017]
MFDKIIRDVIILFESQTNAKGIVLSCVLEPNTLINGDVNRLKQLVIILIDNAIHYTDHQGRIDVKLVKQEKTIEISISDTGIGIDKEHLEKIFDRFYRAEQSRGRNSEGAGLGLAIAKWIVAEQNGSIKVASNPEQGTTFRVSLPDNQ